MCYLIQRLNQTEVKGENVGELKDEEAGEKPPEQYYYDYKSEQRSHARNFLQLSVSLCDGSV